MATLWLPTYLQELQAWFTNPNVYMYGRWDAGTWEEGGVDLSSPGGTPVYALADGPIQGAGYFWHSGNVYAPNSGPPGYGVVTQRVDVPGYGQQDLYYQHIDINPNIANCQGNCTQYLHKGDLIGYIHPGVNMLEMGFNANWGGIWGTNHPGPWANDPRPMLAALLSTGVPANLGGQPTTSLNGIPGSGGGLGLPQQIMDWLDNPQRLFKLIGGIMLVGLAVYMLINPDATQDAMSFIKSGVPKA